MQLADWFRVELNAEGATLDVRPPGKPAWKQSFTWASVIRVCLKNGDMLTSDCFYIFTNLRPESFVVPMDAEGGDKILDALMSRELFPAEVAIKAAEALDGEIHCWPPMEK